MDSKLLLVRSITLLYLESRRLTQNDNSAILVRDIIGHLKAPESLYDTEEGRDIETNLRQTAIWMADQPLGHVYDRTSLLQRIRVNVGTDEGLWEAFKDGLDEPDDQDQLVAKAQESF